MHGYPESGFLGFPEIRKSRYPNLQESGFSEFGISDFLEIRNFSKFGYSDFQKSSDRLNDCMKCLAIPPFRNDYNDLYITLPDRNTIGNT